MNVQSALNAYKETNLSEIEDATPHRLIELTLSLIHISEPTRPY